eukprot:403333155
MAFNQSGDSLLIADSRGQVTYFQLANNRYLVINQSGAQQISQVCFTGKHPQDQAFIIFKDKTSQTHSLNGKLIEKFNQIHQLEVKNIDINTKQNMFLSLSPDACHLWTNSGQNQTAQKVRSIFAKDGLHFVQAKFNHDMQSLVTLLKDGDLIQWSLDTAAQLDAQIFSLNFKSKQITCFDTGINHLVAGGKDLPYLIYKVIQGQQRGEYYFKLPAGCRGIEKLQLLRDKNLLSFISEGYFYLVDLSTQFLNPGSGGVQVKLHIRIPNESIKNFEIDQNMNILVLLTSNGQAYLYDLPVALENERVIQKKKIDMGLEQEVVYTYLERATDDQIMNQKNFDQSQLKSTMTETQNYQGNLMPSFLNPSISMNQQLIESHDFQKSLLEAQRHTISGASQVFSNQANTGNQVIPSNMVSIQSQNYPTILMSNGKSTTNKQEILNSGLSTTLAKKSNYKKPSASIVQSTMQSNFNPNISRAKQQSVISNQQRSVISQQSQIEPQYVLDENYQPDFKLTASTMTQSQMAQFNMPKLKQMLKQFGEYPEKYRFLTWKYLLDLPLNKETFSNLVRRGIHPAFKNLHKSYPIAQHRLYNKLVRTLSALGHWCPIFLDVEFLPSIVFPFIKTIPNDDLMVFELIMCLIVQYMQTWFEAFPSDPLAPLTAIDQIIENENEPLLVHLKSHSFSANIYAWPLIKNLFTEILSKDDWLKFIDHLFTYKEDPEILIYFAAAFLLQSKGALMNIQSAEELHNFQQSPTGIPFKKIMSLAFKLHQKHSQQVFTGHISQNLPLIKNDPNTPQFSGEYPVFNRYPEHIVMNSQKTRQKIAQEEEEILRKQALLEDLKLKSEQILINEENIRRQQEAALQAELERKRKIQTEQELLLQERIRLDEMTRLAKLDHIKKLEEAVMGAINRQEDLKKEEDKVADEELNQRQRLSQYEYQARLQDEVINNLEFKANQRLLEMMQKNQSEDQIRKMKSEFENRQKEEEHRDKVIQERWRLEDQEQKMKNELFRQAMQQQTQTMKQLAEKAKIDEKFRLQEHQKELQLLQIEEQRRLRSLEEEQVLRKQQMLEEMRMRGEVHTSQELDQKWAHLNYEREREKERAQIRMQDIEREKQRLEVAIEREREEKERFDEIQRRQRYEEDIVMNRTILSNFSDQQSIQADHVKRQLQQEREEAENRRIEMMKQEAMMRESTKEKERNDLMRFIKATGENINSIVEKGQKELEERKINRELSTTNSNQQPDYQHLRVRPDSLEYKVLERERQLKEQNDRLLRQYSEEKENMRISQNQGIPPYQGYNQQALQTHSFNPYAQQNINDPQMLSKNQFYTVTSGDGSSHSSMTESNSSLTSSHGDSEAIKKHYQVKQEVEDYHQNFNPATGGNQVFTYQPQPQYPPAQLRGHHLPEHLQQSEKQVRRNKHKEYEQRSLSSKDQESYLHSSSSSNSSGSDGEDDEDNDSSSQFSSSQNTDSQISQKQSAHFNQPKSTGQSPNLHYPQMGTQNSQNQHQFNQQYLQSDNYSSLSSSSRTRDYAKLNLQSEYDELQSLSTRLPARQLNK